MTSKKLKIKKVPNLLESGRILLENVEKQAFLRKISPFLRIFSEKQRNLAQFQLILRQKHKFP